jgi:hypothetical protein
LHVAAALLLSTRLLACGMWHMAGTCQSRRTTDVRTAIPATVPRHGPSARRKCSVVGNTCVRCALHLAGVGREQVLSGRHSVPNRSCRYHPLQVLPTQRRMSEVSRLGLDADSVLPGGRPQCRGPGLCAVEEANPLGVPVHRCRLLPGECEGWKCSLGAEQLCAVHASERAGYAVVTPVSPPLCWSCCAFAADPGCVCKLQGTPHCMMLCTWH